LSVLATGGAGFIGSNLVEVLAAEGERVLVLDNMHTGSTNNLEGLQGKFEVIRGSCNDIADMDLNVEMIYHLGIPSSSPMYKKNPLLVGEALNGFIAVLELAKRCKARVVYASSSSLYSGLNPPHNEDMQIKVTDYYTEARLAMERMAELYGHLFGVRSVGMRFFSVYGPKEESKKQYANMVSQFLWDLQVRRTPVIYGDGLQTRDFVFVKDVVRALKMAMETDYHGILNVGTGKAHSFNDVVAVLNKMLDLSIEPQHIENPIKNYVMHTLADTAKAENVIGFKARYGLEDGIKQIIPDKS
jgi:UDP-glucose 4-epimerase